MEVHSHDDDVRNWLGINKTFGNPGTDGTFWSNLKFSFLNKHPVLGIFFAHPLHPFTRKERCVALFVLVVFSLFIACVMSNPNTPTANNAALRILINTVLVETLFIINYNLLAMPACQDRRNPIRFSYRVFFEKLGYVIMFLMLCLTAAMLYSVSTEYINCTSNPEGEQHADDEYVAFLLAAVHTHPPAHLRRRLTHHHQLHHCFPPPSFVLAVPATPPPTMCTLRRYSPHRTPTHLHIYVERLTHHHNHHHCSTPRRSSHTPPHGGPPDDGPPEDSPTDEYVADAVRPPAHMALIRALASEND